MKSFTFAALAASATARWVVEYKCSWHENIENDGWIQFDRPCPDEAFTKYEYTYEMSEL